MVLYACGPGNPAPPKKSIPNSLFTQSEPIFDSVAVAALFGRFPQNDSIKKEVYKFYAARDYRSAWLSPDGISIAATDFYGQMKNDSKDFGDIDLLNARLDTLNERLEKDAKQFLSYKDSKQQLELLLTVAFFKYARKMYGGITTASKSLEWYIPRKKKNYEALLDSLVLLSPGEKLEEPVNEYYTRLKPQLRLLRDIERKGGFPKVIAPEKTLAFGDHAPALVNIKKYYIMSRDASSLDTTDLLTDSVKVATKRFQKRMGLVENSRLDKMTVEQMNVPVDERIAQVMINLERLRWAPVKMEDNYLLVNIPEFKLHVFEHQKQVWVTNVVVGKAVKQTSIFRDNVSEIILNPYWNVPSSIAQNEILPHINRSKTYLANNNMEVVSRSPFVVRQKPGLNNALGKMKFLFPNSFNIYLHDTPSKNLFGETKRAFSHGCIRVQDPLWLALYLLRKDTAWSKQRVAAVLATNIETGIKLTPVIPLYIAYFTAWVDNLGQLNFRKDIYGLDSKLSKEIFENQ